MDNSDFKPMPYEIHANQLTGLWLQGPSRDPMGGLKKQGPVCPGP